MSLRAELVGASPQVPGFAVVLPDGWGSFAPDGTELRARAARSLRALSGAQRAAVAPQLEELFQTMTSSAAKGNIIRVFAQVDVAPDDYLPLSITASRMDAPVGRSIMEVGAQLIAARGAAPLGDIAGILHWRSNDNVMVADGQVSTTALNYLLPVPGQPAHGLLLRAEMLAAADSAVVDDEGISAMTTLSHAIVSTVRWERRA